MEHLVQQRLAEENLVSLEIGDRLIDREHEWLLRCLQHLLDTPESLHGRDEFFDSLGQLGTELSRHFAHEEALMKSLKMPADLVAEHVKAHLVIIEQYAELNLDLMFGRQHAKNTLVRMVGAWILDHILAYDLKIKPFIQDARDIQEKGPDGVLR